MPHSQCLGTLGKVPDRPPRRATDADPTLLRHRNSVADRQKTVGAERPTDPATSIEFANLLTKVALYSQSLFGSAPGDEVPLITLSLELTKDLSLRALVDCGASNNFVRRQSLEDRRIRFV